MTDTIGQPYITLAEFKNYMSKTGTNDDATMTDAIASATAEINEHCNRQFGKTTTASARVFEPNTMRKIELHDFWTSSGLIVETDPGGTGDFSNVWTVADYELFPLNGIVSSEPGWPYNELRACGGLYFPKYSNEPFRRKGTVRVTAQWGWAAVPAPVRQACFIMAAETWKLKDAPFGVAGLNQSGMGVYRVRQNALASSKLSRFVRYPVLVG